MSGQGEQTDDQSDHPLDDPAARNADAVARDLDELLRLTGCESLGELSDLVYDYAQEDAWLPQAANQPDLPAGLEIRADNLGLTLMFPFEIRELWVAVDDLEEELADETEASDAADEEASTTSS